MSASTGVLCWGRVQRAGKGVANVCGRLCERIQRQGPRCAGHAVRAVRVGGIVRRRVCHAVVGCGQAESHGKAPCSRCGGACRACAVWPPCDLRCRSPATSRAHCVCVCASVCHTARRTLWVCSSLGRRTLELGVRGGAPRARCAGGGLCAGCAEPYACA
jgi:hypothetical protein